MLAWPRNIWRATLPSLRTVAFGSWPRKGLLQGRAFLTCLIRIWALCLNTDALDTSNLC